MYWSSNDLKECKGCIYEMQVIDADCNDCKHFKRGRMLQKPPGTIFEGHCMKFDKPTRAYPVFFTGHECFEHRKDTAPEHVCDPPVLPVGVNYE